MNKKFTRLTALLLAMLMTMSMFSTAFAGTTLSGKEYEKALQQMQDDLNLIPTENESTYSISVDVTSLVPTYEAKEGEVTPEKSITLTATEAYAYQWMICVGSVWANIDGAIEQTLDLTYAMAKSAMDESGNVQIRCRLFADPNISTFAATDSEPIYDDEITANVNGTVTYVEQSGTAEIPVTQYTQNEEVTEAHNNAVAFQIQARNVQPTYTITIDYVLNDGQDTKAANTWTATIQAGTDYSAVIKHPKVLGYEVGSVSPATGITWDANQINLNIEDITGHISYIVKYDPAKVGYKIEHYWQNNDDDKYTLHERTDAEGYTNATVPQNILAKSYAGFYSLKYETLPIAADGSTVVKIYYDRHYYLMDFDLNGGYGVEPIYGRFGAKVAIGEPTRLGYMFDGWSPAVPGEIPVNGGKYTAQWIPADTTYTVVYWQENANDDGYSFYEYETKEAKSGTLVSGSNTKNYAGFHFDSADKDVVVKGDGSTTVNVYYKRNTYTLIFAYQGGDLICDTHVHTNDCYEMKCGQEEHKHTYEGTYSTGSMWNKTTYYVGGCYPEGNVNNRTGGDTQGNVICGKTEHEHTNSCRGNTPICGLTGVSNHNHSVANGCYGMKFENIKYGQDTSYWWNQAPVYRWKTTYSGNTAYTYAPAMPNSNLTVYGQALSSSYQYTIHYYEEGTTNKVHEDNVYYRSSNGYSLTDEDYIAIPGFTCLASGSTSPDKNLVYTIYYRRNSYTLTFKNGSETKDGGTHLYEADISGKNWTPTYTGDDKEGYTFGGWYTTEKCVEGTEFNFTGAKMPANHLILYAKWIPVTHTVNIYLTDKMADKDKIGDTQKISHGKLATEPDTTKLVHPDSDKYKFVGWSYKDDAGNEVGFNFSMAVNQDLNIYAKWRSDEMVSYTIKYALRGENADDPSDDIYIADDTVGTALAGFEKTFEAKTGTALYADYQEGYYPETNSHSLYIDIIEKNNVYTFYYVNKGTVKYTVRYVELLEDGTTVPMKDEGGNNYPDKVVDTAKAVVTEQYVPFLGYKPDDFQKRLVLSADESENVIIFAYVKDEKHAPVQVIHYLQDVTGDKYSTIYRETSELNGIIGEIYSEEILTDITGFEFDHATSKTVVSDETTALTSADGKVSATITANGLIIELYYDRVEYPYEFKFLEQGTEKELHAPVTGSARFEAQVIEDAVYIPGYTFDAASKAIRIQNEETLNNNVAIFYYVETTVDINYEAVGPDGYENFGSVSPETDRVLKVITGTPNGSTPIPNSPTFKFVGWYTDEACTVPVPAEWVDVNGKLTPAKTVDYDTTEEGVAMGYAAATYYAKFELDVGSLTIKKTVKKSDFTDGTLKFTFEVKDANGTVVAEREITVNSVTKSGSVTVSNLVQGVYTVTETNVTGYTATYTVNNVATNTVTVPAGGNAVMEVVNTAYELIEIPVTKVWVDNENMWNLRPASVDVQLVGNGTNVATMQLTSDTWSGSFTNVSKYDSEGKLITYSVTETAVPKYTDVVNENVTGGFTVTNTLNTYDLTIKKAGLDTDLDPNSSTMYQVTDLDGKVNMTVAIHGNSYVTINELPEGSYTVTELTNWSWRYTTTNGAQPITLNADGEVTFTNTRSKPQWLDSDCYAENRFTGSGAAATINPKK